MARGKVTVFGGTGFLGRHVVQHLLECEFSIRVASRHPERTEALFPDVGLGIELIHADINDDRSVAAAVAAVEGVVNAVSSLCGERPRDLPLRPCNRSHTSSRGSPEKRASGN